MSSGDDGARHTNISAERARVQAMHTLGGGWETREEGVSHREAT